MMPNVLKPSQPISKICLSIQGSQSAFSLTGIIAIVLVADFYIMELWILVVSAQSAVLVLEPTGRHTRTLPFASSFWLLIKIHVDWVKRVDFSMDSSTLTCVLIGKAVFFNQESHHSTIAEIINLTEISMDCFPAMIPCLEFYCLCLDQLS